MLMTKIITVVCDQWSSPRSLTLTPSLTAAQILRALCLNPGGALIHQRTTTDRCSGLTVREAWMGRDKPYKKVVAGDVLEAVKLTPPNAKESAGKPEPAPDPTRSSN